MERKRAWVGWWERGWRGIWWNPVAVSVFAFILLGCLLEAVGAGQVITALGMIIGGVLFALILFALALAYVRPAWWPMEDLDDTTELSESEKLRQTAL